MRKLFTLFLAFMLLCLTGASALADALTIAGLDPKTMIHPSVSDHDTGLLPALWLSEWQSRYPGVPLDADNDFPYRSTSALLRALESGDTRDVLMFPSYNYDWNALKASGSLRDLSDDPELVALVAGMRAPFVEAAYHEGKLYGIPCGITLGLGTMRYDVEAWTLAGYTEADMPASLTSLVDFLESWAERCRREPATGVCVTNILESYSAADHTSWLTEYIIDLYAQQCRAQGLSASFDTPEFVALLERLPALGQALSESDPVKDSTHCLLESFIRDGDMPYYIPTRLNDGDPQLIPVYISILCVPEKGGNADAAMDFLRLYTDCVRNHTYDDSTAITFWDCEAIRTRALVFEGAPGTVPSPADHMWLTADELAAIQPLTGRMRVVSGYAAIPYLKENTQRINQFASGRLTAQELARQLITDRD